MLLSDHVNPHRTVGFLGRSQLDGACAIVGFVVLDVCAIVVVVAVENGNGTVLFAGEDFLRVFEDALFDEIVEDEKFGAEFALDELFFALGQIDVLEGEQALGR